MKWRSQAQLRDGRTMLIRNLYAQDAQTVLDTTRLVMGETPYLSRYPDECVMSAAQEVEWIERAQKNPRGLNLGAFVDGKLVGMCSMLPVAPQERMRHRGGVGLSVVRAYWHMGVGAALLTAAINGARLCGLEQLELDVTGENERARALYRRFGFVEFGIHRRAMKYRDGRYADLVLMQLDLAAQEE